MTTQELLKEARKVIARMGAPRGLKGAIEVLQMLRAELAVRNLEEGKRQALNDERFRGLARDVSALRAWLAAEIEKREKVTRVPGRRCSSCGHEGRSAMDRTTRCLKDWWECAWDATVAALDECESMAESCSDYQAERPDDSELERRERDE